MTAPAACPPSWSIVALSALVLFGCHKSSAPASTKMSGSYSVSGLEACAHRPLVILRESDAWSGSPDLLPTVTVYEDGLVIRASWDEHKATRLTESRIPSPKSLAEDLERRGLWRLAPRSELNAASDQPEVSIDYRIGEVWRSVTLVGLHPDESVPFQLHSPPASFLEAYRLLRSLRTGEERPLARTEFRVALTNDSIPSREAIDWPAGIPAPPALVPDTRYVGDPRSYTVTGDDGAKLYAFVRQPGGRPTVRLPSGDRLEVWVRVQIPDQRYIERVARCASWEAQPYHVCERD